MPILPIEPTAKKKPAILSYVLWAVGGLVGAYIVFTAVMAVGDYGFSWRSSKVVQLTRWTPLPAAVVGYRPVMYASYLDTLATVDFYNKAIRVKNPGLLGPSSDLDNKKTALTKLVRDAAIDALMQTRKLSISQLDLDQAYQTQVVQGGNEQTVTQAIKDLYGWTPAEFKTHVLQTVVKSDKLQESLSFSDADNAAAKKQAEAVLALVKEGKTSFEDLAKQYSDDAYGAKGGDVGFVSRGAQLKELDDAAFALAVNQTSDLVHTKYGFHILKVLEKKTDQGQEQVHLEEIFVSAPTPDKVINGYLKAHGVRLFAPGLRWDKANVQIIGVKETASAANANAATNTAPKNTANTNTATNATK